MVEPGDEAAEAARKQAAWDSITFEGPEVVGQVVRGVKAGFAACEAMLGDVDDAAEETSLLRVAALREPWAKLVEHFNRVSLVQSAPESRRTRLGNAWFLLNWQLSELESMLRRDCERLNACQMKNFRQACKLASEAFEVCLNPPPDPPKAASSSSTDAPKNA